jgi:hypothetical protein
MKTETREQHRQIDEALHVPPEKSAPGNSLDPISWVPRVTRIHEPYSVRSARNIQYWRSFLPEKCVLTMIKMGWDRTT